MADPSGIALDQLLEDFADLLAAKIAARIAANGNGHTPEEPDQLLTVAEAALRLGVKPRWIYGHASTLPFVVRLPGRGVRFSARGLQRFIERRRG